VLECSKIRAPVFKNQCPSVFYMHESWNKLNGGIRGVRPPHCVEDLGSVRWNQGGSHCSRYFQGWFSVGGIVSTDNCVEDLVSRRWRRQTVRRWRSYATDRLLSDEACLTRRCYVWLGRERLLVQTERMSGSHPTDLGLNPLGGDLRVGGFKKILSSVLRSQSTGKWTNPLTG
jgi:hypothetical protein